MSTVPAWVKDAVFYQIFPERFANGDPSNDPPGVQPWGGAPRPGNYFGGDLRGIIDRIGYIRDLGVNALYLNPVFWAESNHKYNTRDYLRIDPAFGTNETFDELLTVCHANGIRVVIDGVFNHVGTAHASFQDVKEKGKASPYAAWFNIYSFPVAEARHPNYECWWGHGSLPKLMTQHPEVKKHLFDVTRYWTEKGIDGWRLDVPNEVPHPFWKEWRSLVKGINPDCYIVGELWEDASPWLRGDEFDATMNYRFRQACLDFFVHRKTTGAGLLEALSAVRASYSDDSNYAMQNLLGSHDTERYLTLCGGSTAMLECSVTLQMTSIGAPMVYYGDEIGIEGGKDPDCRRCMEWEPEKQNGLLLKYVRSLIRIRNSHSALRRGGMEAVPFTADAGTEDIVLFRRSDGAETVLVAVNRGASKRTVRCAAGAGVQTRTDLLTGRTAKVDGAALRFDIPASSARLFTLNQGA